MRLILSLSLAFISLSVVAQNPFSPDFPFPYNPDGNADGYIGLNDMLDLLSVYGQQYPESFYTDSSAAILNLGRMPPHVCIREARLAGSKWRVMAYDDYWNHFDLLSEVGQQWYEGLQTTNGEDFVFFYQQSGVYSYTYLRFKAEDGGLVIGDMPGNQGFSFDVGVDESIWSGIQPETQLVHYSKHCLLVTEVYPEIEYHIVSGSLGEVQSAVNDSLSNGWKLQGGLGANGQAIWKYTE